MMFLNPELVNTLYKEKKGLAYNLNMHTGLDFQMAHLTPERYLKFPLPTSSLIYLLLPMNSSNAFIKEGTSHPSPLP